MSSLELSSVDVSRIMDKFPDGIDVWLVDGPCITEEVPGEQFSTDIPLSACYTKKCELVAVEIEPETGIFAAMSPITHRIYVYTKDYYG